MQLEESTVIRKHRDMIPRFAVQLEETKTSWFIERTDGEGTVNRIQGATLTNFWTKILS